MVICRLIVKSLKTVNLILTFGEFFNIICQLALITRLILVMIIKTRVFEMAGHKYRNLSDLAKAMELSISQVYRVREGKRGINEKFIVGAKKAFPESRLDDLFYFKPDESSHDK